MPHGFDRLYGPVAAHLSATVRHHQPLPIAGLPVTAAATLISRALNWPVALRTRLTLTPERIDWLRQGLILTTIQHRRYAAELPAAGHLTLYDTAAMSPPARVGVTAVIYSRFGDLTPADASRAGFDEHEHMRHTLTRSCPDLTTHSWVTIHHLTQPVVAAH